MNGYCNYCHFETAYRHYHNTGEKRFGEIVYQNQGVFSDANGMCLPCQVMHGFVKADRSER